MGIPGSLFFHPDLQDPFRSARYGRLLAAPIGVAAGPHSQMALNIVAAWLCGARYIELKTIQVLDELDVSKPCIDMQDEGYNCEWSQELTIRESFSEYLNGWIILHILHKELGFKGEPGTLFNMSVGYNLEGIKSEKVRWFLSRMRDCSGELIHAKNAIREVYPAIDSVHIPALISDHVTLSTMHGCPPEEIEKIASYLIREEKLHTTVKLNPTLLGSKELRELLNRKLGFITEVPDLAFEHDLTYPDALHILDSLTATAAGEGLQFGVKLTNTLESVNHKTVFGPSESMMYMSGRALHPISINLARKLQNDRAGTLDISFSGGADCFNIADVIACGLKPVTVCSDLLKPGGYGRLHQYIDNLRKGFSAAQAGNTESFIRHVAGFSDMPGNSLSMATLANLNRYADQVSGNPRYQKQLLLDPDIKTTLPLGWFDCIHAPCTDTCPASQEIPEYLYHTAQGDIPAALETILRTNPFPSVTGMVCDHLCQLKCTRINYDEAVAIREVKRFVAESAVPGQPLPAGKQAGKMAVIGAGPAGLSCAWFLHQGGFEVDIFEQKNLAGGMISAAIPSFRLTAEATKTDIGRILDSGIQLHDRNQIDKEKFGEILKNYTSVFLAAGAQESVKIDIEGSGLAGVIDPLEFLFQVKKDHRHKPGNHVVIIGGGNTAMDAARTAFRLVGELGSVTIVYRRTLREMPADRGEIEAVLREGITVMELTTPVRVKGENGKVTAIVCLHNVLAMNDKSGRRGAVAIPGSEFEIPCDTVIPAIGQKLAIDFVTPENLKTEPGHYKTRVDGLYIGGDALRGASTAINAIADGRKAALEMIAGILQQRPPQATREGMPGRVKDIPGLLHRKSIREYGCHPGEITPGESRNFDVVVAPLGAAGARQEASRCLQCDEICNVCVSVCPNLANFSYSVEPVCYSLQKAVADEKGTVSIVEDIEFHVDQPYQVMNIRDLCNECGNCTTFCPSAGRPFLDKPGLCLSVKSLNEEQTGFLLSSQADRDVLIYKEKENVRTLTLTGGNYIYETNQVRAVIRPDDFTILEVKLLAPCVREARFSFAAWMSIVLKGAMQMKLAGYKG